MSAYPDDFGVYQASALSARDDLLVSDSLKLSCTSSESTSPGQLE